MGSAASKGERGHCSVPRLKAGEVVTCVAKKMTPGEELKDVHLHLEQVKELGRGAFGVVNQMLCATGNEEKSKPVAVKVPAGDRATLAKIELSLLASLSHRNVVALLYFFPGLSRDSFNIVLELVDGGDLFHYMKKHYTKEGGMGVFFELFRCRV